MKNKIDKEKTYIGKWIKKPSDIDSLQNLTSLLNTNKELPNLS